MLVECWVYGESVHSHFHVKISSTTYVGALKKVIKNKRHDRFHDVDANNLDLYSISRPDHARLEGTLKQLALKNKLSLHPEDLLSGLNLSDSLIIVDGFYLGVHSKSSQHHIILLMAFTSCSHSGHDH